MPLTADENPAIELDDTDLVFTMMDGEARIVCRVTTVYLFTRAAASNLLSLSPVALFGSFRAEIEHIASEKFDSGQKLPRVTSRDFVRGQK
jgi:uncharacterized protein DUF1488